MEVNLQDPKVIAAAAAALLLVGAGAHYMGRRSAAKKIEKAQEAGEKILEDFAKEMAKHTGTGQATA